MYLLLIFGGLGAHLAKAIAAIDRPVPTGLEGDHRIGPAFGAHDGVHLPWRILVHAAPLLRATHRTATAAAFGFVGKTSSVEKLLLARGKDKFAPALHTGKGLV